MTAFLSKLSISSRRSAWALFFVSAVAGSGIVLAVHDNAAHPAPSSASR